MQWLCIIMGANMSNVNNNDKSSENLMLYIPIGINTRIDFMPGFGKSELSQAIIGIAVGILIAILGYVITNQMLTVVIIMIFAIGGSVLATTKNDINISIVDYVNNILKFNKERQVFPYRQAKI